MSNFSGTIFHLLEAFRRCNVGVQLISPLKTTAARLLLPHKIAAALTGKKVDAERFPRVLSSFARQIAAQLDGHESDVVFCPSSVPVTLLKCRQPIVFYTDALFHSISSYYPAFERFSAAALQRGRAQEETALKNARFAVYASEWAAQTALQWAPASKLRVIPYGANFLITHTSGDVEAYLQTRLKTLTTGLTLLFVGVDWRRKGGAVALACARRLNNLGIPTKLWIVGCEPPRPIPAFAECFGFIAKDSAAGIERLASLFRHAHILILPTRAEATGIVFCEASAFGLPIITYDTGGTPTYVPEDVSGYRMPISSHGGDFADKIRSLVQSRHTYCRLSRSSYSQYTQRLNWNTSVASLLKLFEQSRAESPGSPPALTKARGAAVRAAVSR